MRLGALVFTVRAMHVRSFEIHEVADTDLRRLHDYLLEVGGFEFRAGGSGFFVLVGERFVASAGATNAQVIMASREADTINVDVVAAGGGNADAVSLRPHNGPLNCSEASLNAATSKSRISKRAVTPLHQSEDELLAT